MILFIEMITKSSVLANIGNHAPFFVLHKNAETITGFLESGISCSLIMINE